jgi:hypothetical protein
MNVPKLPEDYCNVDVLLSHFVKTENQMDLSSRWVYMELS